MSQRRVCDRCGADASGGSPVVHLGEGQDRIVQVSLNVWAADDLCPACLLIAAEKLVKRLTPPTPKPG